MPSADRLSGSSSARVLSSDWGGLNRRLLLKLYPMKRAQSGDGWTQDSSSQTLSNGFVLDNGYEVHAPITDGNFEMSFNWTSPFEGAGAESKAPTLSAMLQSGALSSAMQTFLTVTGQTGNGSAQQAVSAIDAATGRTGITKLNSTQTFTGMPPAKVSVTAHFRALREPLDEVRYPIRQLEEWSVPQYLAPESVLANAAKTGGKDGVIQTVYPSMTPQILGLQYGDMNLFPVVIESIGRPITNPRTESGVMLHCAVQLSISTLAALDRADIRAMYP